MRELRTKLFFVVASVATVLLFVRRSQGGAPPGVVPAAETGS